MKRIFALALIVASFAGLTLTSDVEAYDGPVPFFYEPDPICGSTLDTQLRDSCTRVEDAPVVIGNRYCPDLSQGRFDDEFYDFVEDDLSVVFYNSPIELWISIDRAREWQDYCVIPPPPLATPTPVPTVGVPNPTPVPFECPVGYIMVADTSSGLIRCLLPTTTPTQPVAAPVPGFTG